MKEKMKNSQALPAEPALHLIRSEVNFLIYPFFQVHADNRWHLNQLKIEHYRTLDRGEEREEVSWRVLGHQEFGLPGPFDWELHKAIEEIINERGFPVRNPVPFSQRDLCRRMGISYHGNKTTAEIKASFRRTCHAAVESKRTFYSKSKKRWIEDTFHLYDRVVYRGEEMPEGDRVAETNYLYLGSWYLENLNALYVTLLDYRYRRSLSEAIARRLYEILGVKFYGLQNKGAPYLRYAYTTLCELLPVRRQPYLSYAHRQLDPAHRELIETGFLEQVEWQEIGGELKEWHLYYYPGERARKPASELPLRLEEEKLPNLQELGSAPISSLAGGTPSQKGPAWELVCHFRKGCPGKQKGDPRPRELQQAEVLIRELGEERARHVVAYALRQAPQTGFQMKHFGAVLGYKQEALSELERREQREKEQEAERRRQEEEQQRALAERQLQERAAQVLAALPNEQREAYRQKALEMTPAALRESNGFLEMQMRCLVLEDGLVA
jgi:hypothetical protein